MARRRQAHGRKTVRAHRREPVVPGGVHGTIRGEEPPRGVDGGCGPTAVREVDDGVL